MKPTPPTVNGHPKDLLFLYVEGLLSTETSTLVERHLHECEECRHELELISSTVSLLKSNKKVFCPEPWELAEFAVKGDECNGFLKTHMEHCPLCAKEFEELSSPGPTSLPAELWSAIQEEYGGARGKHSPWAWSKSLGSYLQRFVTAFKMPLMGIGAVAAALLLVVIFIQGLPLRGRPVVALSAVNWDESSSGLIPKGSISLMGAARKKDIGAVVIYFSSEQVLLPLKQIDELYEQLKPGPHITATVKVISPDTIQKKLGLNSIAAISKNDLLEELHAKCGVTLAVLVSLTRDRDGYDAQIEVIELPSQSVVYHKHGGPFSERELGEQLRVSVQDGLEQSRKSVN